MPTSILFLLVLLLVVIVHEAGHFFAAKRAGMRVKEFAFGFPPRLFGWTKGETKYSINAIPLGGYVSIDGENGNEVSNDPRIFTNKSKAAQAWVLFAGPLMNILLAIVLMIASYMIGYGVKGAPDSLVILSVQEGSPAEIAGIKPGDIIHSLHENEDVTLNPSVEAFRTHIAESNGEPIFVGIDRGERHEELDAHVEEPFVIIPEKVGEEYRVGVSMGILESKQLGFFPAIKEGTLSALRMTRDTFVGFGKIIASLFGGESLKGSLTGPVGIAKEVGTASNFGFAYLLSFIALISINLGVLNLFPFPALDGGRLLFLLIEKIKGSRIRPSTAATINTVGFGLLLALMVWITIKDVIKLF